MAKDFKEFALSEAKMTNGADEIAKAKRALNAILTNLNKLDYKKDAKLATVYDMSQEASEFCHDAKGGVKEVAQRALKEDGDSYLSDKELKFIIKNADLIELSMTIDTNDVREITSVLEKIV